MKPRLDDIRFNLENGGCLDSKSNTSRVLIDATTEKLAQFVGRKLDELDLIAMFIDGIEFAGHAVLVALGVTIDGTKTPLGIWAGSTENTTVVTELLSNLVGRGLRVDIAQLVAPCEAAGSPVGRRVLSEAPSLVAPLFRLPRSSLRRRVTQPPGGGPCRRRGVSARACIHPQSDEDACLEAFVLV